MEYVSKHNKFRQWRVQYPTLWIFVVIPFISHRRSNEVGEKCLSLSLCAFQAEDSLSEENRIGAIHIIGLRNLISHSLIYLFCVNCAFLAVNDFSIAAMHLTVSLGSFASAEATRWLCPLDPCKPLKRLDLNFSLASHHSNKVEFCKNSAFRIPNSEFYKILRCKAALLSLFPPEPKCRRMYKCFRRAFRQSQMRLLLRQD